MGGSASGDPLTAQLMLSSAPTESILTLAPLQEGLLFHSLYSPLAPFYVDQMVLALEGPPEDQVEPAALAEALRLALARHPALRASFHWEGLDRPLQVVHEDVAAPLEVLDWRDSAPGGEERLAAFLRRDRRRGFDLTRPPLLRLTLARSSERSSWLVFTAHHILLDGWSSSLLLDDLLHLYGRLRDGAAPDLPAAPAFSDFLSWLERRDLAAAEAFWRERLRGFRAPTPLLPEASAPFGLPAGPSAGAGEGEAGPEPELQAEAGILLPPAATAALRELAGRHRLTLNTLVQGAWVILLHRYSGETDLVFGATVSGRPEDLPGVERTVGLFINTLPVRVRLSGAEGLVPWLAALQEEQVAAHPFEQTPLPSLQRWSEVPAGRPLFESLLVFENAPGAGAGLAGAGGPRGSRGVLTVRGSRSFTRTHYPLSLLVEPGEELAVRVTVDRRRLELTAGRRLLEHLANLLSSFVRQPMGALSGLEMLGEAERHQLVSEWGEAKAPPPALLPLHAGFERQAALRPEALAVIVDPPARSAGLAGPAGAAAAEPGLTYRELNRRAAELARHLRAMGARPEVPMVVPLARTADALVTLIAVLKAGAAYVPVESAAPRARLAAILADTGGILVDPRKLPVMASAVAAGGHEGLGGAAAKGSFGPAGGESDPRRQAAIADHLAYVIYTSGSTGMPKGVGVSHRVAAGHFEAAADRYGVQPGERVLQFASLAFDAGLEQVFVALLRGATVAMRGEETWDTAGLDRRLARLRVDVANLPTVYWERWARDLAGGTGTPGPAPVAGGETHRPRLVLPGGEALSAEAVRAWRRGALAGTALINDYGPTEGVVTAACHAVPAELPAMRPGATVPVGRCLAGRSGWLLDGRLEPVALGVPGELCLGGPLLARGYLRRPELTAASFVPDPFSGMAGGRLYRTGDRMRALPDGCLEFLGRGDQQVKVRGVRLELGEVEAALQAHPQVSEAAVVAWRRSSAAAEKEQDGATGAWELAAAIVPTWEALPAPDAGQATAASDRDEAGPRVPAAAPEPGAGAAGPEASRRRALRGELRERLRESLPPAARPVRYLVLPRLPRTPGGKVDRVALLDLLERPPGLAGGGWEEGAGEGETAESLPAGHAEAWRRSPVAELVAGLWCAVLGLERVAPDDDFLALGGHSLTAIQLLSRLREAFEIELPLAALFEATTVESQAERIAALLRERSAAGGEPGSPSPSSAAAPALLPAGRDAPLPVSFAQRRLWVLDRLDPGLPAYNVPLALGLSGALAPAALAGALTALAARHEPLRTRFEQDEDGPVQRILPPAAVALPQVDLGALPAARREAELARLAGEEAARRFDLARGRLLRASLLRLAAEEWALLLTLHHIVSDGWSIGILWRELALLYGARGAAAGGRAGAGSGQPLLPPLPVQYADFAAWQRQALGAAELARQLGFWRRRLAGAPQLLPLPADRPRPPVRSFRGGLEPLRLDEEAAAAALALARRERATPFMVLLAAFAEVLARYAGRRDLLVGTPVAGRDRLETEGLIGFFVNTLVLRAELEAGRTARSLIARIRAATLEAFTHQDVPFERLVEELVSERSLALTPLFQVLFTCDSPPAPPRLAGLRTTPLDLEAPVAKFDLALSLTSGGPGGPARPRAAITGGLVYSRDLFDASTAARLAAHYAAVLAAMADAPDLPLDGACLLSPGERQQLLVEWNDTPGGAAEAAGGEGPELLHELFVRQAGLTPAAAALVYDNEPLSYRELDRRSARLARELVRQGVGPDVPVGIFMDRAPEMVIAMFGVLRAGGAYLPLDPAYPEQRIALTLADCGAPLVITQEWLTGRLPTCGARLLVLAAPDAPDSPDAAGEGDWLPRPGSRVSSDNLACLIYTSGSTGRPKGVAVTHRGAAALLRWGRRLFPPERLTGVLAGTSICFDISVFEIFLPLCCGGTVLLAETVLDLMMLAGGGRVSLVNSVPSAIAELVRAGGLPASLAALNLAGEPISPALSRALASRPEPVFNLYGPTETTVYSTAARLSVAERESGRPAPIGRPIDGTRIYLVDGFEQGLAPVPLGAAGALCIAGSGLARGYLRRPELTAERFVPDPFSAVPGGRLYRTGDLARYRGDGCLEFLGRGDRQIKVRGFRIELGEIEAALALHPRLADCAVVLREDPPAEPLLAAYIVAAAPASPERPDRAGDGIPDLAGVRAFLQDSLPDFMLPMALVELPALPRTASGKVDRRALPAPGVARPAGVFVEPRGELERRIAAVMSEVLEVERVGREESFFSLGGHSLRMIRAAGKLETALGRKLQVIELFRFPTVAALAAHLTAGERDLPSTAEQAVRGDERRMVRERRRDLRQEARASAAAARGGRPPAAGGER